MNIKKIEKQLKKINQLFNTIKEDGTVSAIEKDLMLSYVRGLYEKIVEPQNNSSDNASKSNDAKLQVSQPKEIIETPKVEKNIPQTDDVAAVVMKEVAEADQIIPNNTSSNQFESNTSMSSHKETIVQEVVEAPKQQIPEELAKLFKFESANEISDKLSRSPISDLTKCMGINEKIFTVQELFGGDSGLFNTSMESLDKLSSIEQARDYLVEHVAVDQHWGAEGKIKKAANFIKLISRRY